MISVITPVYNGASYLRETIDSILNAINQKDIEYIVINDGSTDETEEILASYGSQIMVYTQENSGESSAVNKGLELAKGELVLIVSADDPLLDDKIFIEAETYFNANPDVVAWYPNWKIVNPNGTFFKDVEVEEYSDTSLIGRFKCLPGPGTLIRLQAALEISGRNPKWIFVGDYDFWLRLSRIGKLQKRDEYLAQWRFHPDSTSIAKRGKMMASERIEVINEFLSTNKVDQSLAREARAHAYYYAARLSLFSSEVPGKKYLWFALRSNKWKIQEGNFFVYISICFLPITRILVKKASPILRKFGKVLT